MKLKAKSYYSNKISSALSSIWFLVNKYPKPYRDFLNSDPKFTFIRTHRKLRIYYLFKDTLKEFPEHQNSEGYDLSLRRQYCLRVSIDLLCAEGTRILMVIFTQGTIIAAASQYALLWQHWWLNCLNTPLLIGTYQVQQQ